MFERRQYILTAIFLAVWPSRIDADDFQENALQLGSIFEGRRRPQNALPIKLNIEADDYFLGWGRAPQATPGGNTLASTYRLLSRMDDYLLNLTADHEDRQDALSIARRFGRSLILDIPFALWAMYMTHEFFGHGGKLREMGFPVEGYRFETWLHIPYRAFTFYDKEIVRQVSIDQIISLAASGVMATQTTASELAEQILSREYTPWSYWPVWFMNKFDFTGYAFQTPRTVDLNFKEQTYKGHDMANYIILTSELGRPRSQVRSELMAAALWNILDPLLLTGVLNYVVRELAQGKQTSPNPMANINGYQFFVGTRSGLTLTSPEIYLDLYMRNPRNGLLLKGTGRRGFAGEFGGGFSLSHIRLTDNLEANFNANFWQQRETSGRGDFQGFDVGGGVNLYLREHAGLYAEGGYKTKGVVMGRQLEEGPYFDGGLILRY